LKSFIEGEEYEISFRLENIGEIDFPGGMLRFSTRWPSLQEVRQSTPIKPLKKGEYTETRPFGSDVLCRGYGLIFIETPDIRDDQGRPLEVEFYSGKRVEDFIDTRAAVSSIKARTWEEIYEFWALIIAAISLLIIASDKILTFIQWVSRLN
jgi:hypothetical protein